MNKYAIFIGDAPENYRMKKIEDMYDFLQTTQGGTIPRSNIIGFPNGISELFLEATIDRCMNEETKASSYTSAQKPQSQIPQKPSGSAAKKSAKT